MLSASLNKTVPSFIHSMNLKLRFIYNYSSYMDYMYCVLNIKSKFTSKFYFMKRKVLIYLFILFYFILFYFILFYFILFYFILFYFILLYFILFYFIFYFLFFIFLKQGDAKNKDLKCPKLFSILILFMFQRVILTADNFAPIFSYWILLQHFVNLKNVH